MSAPRAARHSCSVLAVDLGTSGAKVGLVSVAGHVMDWEFEPTQLYILPEGGAEQDPADWEHAVLAAAHRLLDRNVVARDDVVAICCTTQWSGTVAVDDSGRSLMNAIIWMDARGERYVRDITGGLLTVEGYGVDKLLTWLRLTGGIPAHSGKDSIAHVLTIKHEFPEVYAAADCFLEPKDYLNFWLTGIAAASYDSIALHWVTDNRDISRIDYHPRLLELVAVPRGKLPDLRRAVDILGPLRPEIASELGLSDGLPIIVGTPDVHSAAIGAGTVADYHAHLYIGTSSWLTCHVPYKKTDIFNNMASLPSAIPDRYLVANEQEAAGACLTFLRDHILFPEDGLGHEAPRPDGYTFLSEIAAGAPAGSHGVIFTPWLYGERTPVEDDAIRAGFHNLSLHAKRADLVRAVFEGVAFNSRWLLEAVEQFVGRRLDPISIVGGGANSNLWCQVHADVLQRTVRQVRDPMLANLRGAAFLAFVALGQLAFHDIPERVPIASEYRLEPGRGRLYDQLFREFVNIYDNNRRIYERLNRPIPT